jgi:hypothetical protein
MGALQSRLTIALTVLSGCLSSLVEGVVKISKNKSEDHVWFEDFWMVAPLCDE